MVDTALPPTAGASSASLPDRSVVPPVWGRITNLVVDRGEGSWLITTRRRALPRLQQRDRGHEHRPRPSAGRRRGPGAGGEAPPRPAEHHYHEPGLRLYERLRHVLPGDGWGAFLSNSGAEAVEAAVKLARIATGRPVILGFRYGYHGRTGQTMALTTAKDVYRGHFEPLPGQRLPHGLPVLLPGARRRRTPRTRTAPATGRPSST